MESVIGMLCNKCKTKNNHLRKSGKYSSVKLNEQAQMSLKFLYAEIRNTTVGSFFSKNHFKHPTM